MKKSSITELLDLYKEFQKEEKELRRDIKIFDGIIKDNLKKNLDNNLKYQSRLLTIIEEESKNES